MKSLLFEMLGSILDGTEFRLKKSDDSFVRKIGTGWQELGLPLVDHNPDFIFSLNICIRLDSVEDIFNLFSGAPSKFQPGTTTTITRLDYFTGGNGKYKVSTPSEVAAAGGTLKSFIKDRIIPFLNEHTNVRALDEAINRKIDRVDITQNPAGAMHAVILAHLARNNRFEDLVVKHRKAMQLDAGVDHMFNRLVDYLRVSRQA